MDTMGGVPSLVSWKESRDISTARTARCVVGGYSPNNKTDASCIRADAFFSGGQKTSYDDARMEDQMSSDRESILLRQETQCSK